MKYISGIRIKNYRLLRDVSLGTTAPNTVGDAAYPAAQLSALTPLTVIIGRNGYGKSTLCDALGFIVDCLKSDVEQACLSRGGFSQIFSKGNTVENADGESNRLIEFQIRYGKILYTLCIAADEYNVPFIYAETLSHITADFRKPDIINFYVNSGEGKVVEPNSQTVSNIRLADKRRLALSTLGNLSQFSDIVSFRQFLDSWYLCYFTPESVRTVPSSGPQRHLSKTGSNLANVVQFWEREHSERLNNLLHRVLGNVLGVERLETAQMEDGRLLLRFFEKGKKQPFYVNQMSDGTLKLISYMLLLGDPEPPPLICFEEPENGLYHRLLAVFVDEIRRRCEETKGTQFFITTHQPYLVDALLPNEVWILEKGRDGFAQIRRACDDPVVQNMVEEGMPLGALWFSEYLDG